MADGAAQRGAERLAGLGLKHSVISVRPLAGALGRSRSNSSAANLSTALNLQGRNLASSKRVPLTVGVDAAGLVYELTFPLWRVSLRPSCQDDLD